MASDYTRPHWHSSALVVVDLQRAFLDDGDCSVPGTSGVLPNAATLTAAFRRADRPVVHVVRLYPPGKSDVDLVRRAAIEKGASFLAPGSRGSQVPSALLPAPMALDADALLDGQHQDVGPREWILFKPRWSAFYRTPLEGILRRGGCDTIVVAGCNLPNCPRATLIDASERDFRTVLVRDAVSQTTDERLADLSAIGVHVLTIADLAAVVPWRMGTWSTP
jgi:nicotinamidase-related amidase